MAGVKPSSSDNQTIGLLEGTSCTMQVLALDRHFLSVIERERTGVNLLLDKLNQSTDYHMMLENASPKENKVSFA